MEETPRVNRLERMSAHMLGVLSSKGGWVKVDQADDQACRISRRLARLNLVEVSDLGFVRIKLRAIP